MEKEFDGELSRISPEKLVSEDRFEKLDSFFLALATIFNDLKTLILFDQLLVDTYRKPRELEVSAHSGNYGGVRMYINKLIASTINEFFIFLKKNGSILDVSEFQQLLRDMPREYQEIWRELFEVALGQLHEANDFLKTLAIIRSNIAFHFDHSGGELRKGFISYFFTDSKNPLNEFAYYSLGDSTALTRFYFADAAIQEFQYIAAGKLAKSNDRRVVDEYQERAIDVVVTINDATQMLLKKFLQSRRNRPN